MIASLRPVDELSLIHDRLACGTATVVVLNRVWRRCRPKRSPQLRPRLRLPLAVVEASRPQVADDRDPDAPGDGDQAARADRCSQQLATQRFDHRRDRLVLGEPGEGPGHRVGRDEAAAQEEQQDQDHGGVAGGLDAVGGHAKRDREPGDRQRGEGQQAGGRDPIDRSGRRAEPDHDGDHHHDGDGKPRLDDAAQDVAGEDRDTGDVHRPEPGDDALVHVHGDRDGRALGGADHGHEQDPWDHVRDVRGATTGHLAEAGAERAAEHVHEQQQQHDRKADHEERQRGVPPHPAEVSSKHRRGVRDDQGIRGHEIATFSSWLSPVSDRKTSSSSGVWSEIAPTVMEPASS